MPYIKIISNSKELIAKYECVFRNSLLSHIFGDLYDICILILENADNLKHYKIVKEHPNYHKLEYKKGQQSIWFKYLYIVNVDLIEELNSAEFQEEKIRTHFNEYEFDGSNLFTQNSLYSHERIIYLLQDRIKRKKICWYNL